MINLPPFISKMANWSLSPVSKPFYVSLKPFLHPGAYTRPADWPTIFNNQNPIEVEIGFGNGEYLAEICGKYPTTNFIGFEQYCERIARTLRKLSRASSSNVRVMRLDAKAGIERYFAERSITKIHCLYPPPWPKKSDAKHRLFTTEFMRTMNNRLIDGGVFLLVTDWKPYTEWIQEQLPGTGFELEFNFIQPSYNTKFENKWVDGGQREFYQMVLTKKIHQDVPVKKDTVMQTYSIEKFNADKFHPQEIVQDGIAVTFKDLIYDPKRQVAMIYAIVSDESVMQHVRICVTHSDKGWRVHLAQGTLLMPTAGVALALEQAYKAACVSAL